MKPAPFEYVRPDDIGEVIAALAADENSKLIAGGQSLVPLMALRLARPSLLVDIAGLGLDMLSIDGGEMQIGATVTHRRLERDPVVGQHLPLLRAAAALIGYPAIRVRGTIGGSLAHADPVAELPAVLLATAGSVVVEGRHGRRSIAASDLFQSFLTTTIQPDEVLVEVRVPLPDRHDGAAFCEWSPRAGDFATAGIAVVVERSADGVCTGVRAAACGLADTPVDCTQYVAGIVGEREPSDGLLRKVARHFGDHELHGLLAAPRPIPRGGRRAAGVGRMSTRIELDVNDGPVELDVEPARHLARRRPRTARAYRRPRGMRARVVRGLHGAVRRRTGALVPGVRGAVRGSAHRDHRGLRAARATPPRDGRIPEAPCAPVRVLYAGDGARSDRLAPRRRARWRPRAGDQRRGDRRRGPAHAGRQPLSLHRLRRHRRGGARRRGIGTVVIGDRLLRHEDARLVSGRGRYLADHDVPGLLHLAILRSTEPHARIAAIDTAAAAALRGVVAVLTQKDLDAAGARPMSHRLPLPGVQPLEWTVLARDVVRFVGEPMAAVVATSRAVAEDALDLIEVDDEPFGVVVDPFAAAAPGAPLLYPEWGTNEFFRFTVSPPGLDEAIAAAPHVLRTRFTHHRVAAVPLEGHGAQAARDPATGVLQVYASNQQPHQLRTVIAETCGLGEDRVRVIAPDMGGGFGNKQHFTREECLVASGPR